MSVSQTPTAEARTFERDLLDAPDLADLSAAARRVLATAAVLFHRDGAVATSVRDITRSCGLSPGALYNHFPAKDDLLLRIVVHGHDALDRRIREARTAAEPAPLAQCAAFVRAYVLAHLEQPEMAQVVRREYVHLSPARVSAVVHRRRRVRDELGRLVQDGIDAGRLTPVAGSSATATAVMILDMCSRTSEWYDRAGSSAPAEVAQRYVAAALRLAGAEVQV